MTRGARPARHPEVSGQPFPEFSSMNGPISVFDLLDADGRPFGEMNAAAAIRQGVPMEHRSCPYAGSRRGKEMNVSALRQVAANWQRVLDCVRALRRRYARGVESPRTLWRLRELGVCLASLPGYLVARGVPPSALPGSVGALFKTSQGVFMTANRAILGGANPEGRPTARWFVDAAERLRALTIDERACAGPPAMILEFIRAVMGQGPRSSRRPDPLLPWAQMLESWTDYGQAVSSMLWLWKLVEARSYLACFAVRDRVAQQRSAAEQSSLTAIDAWLRRHFSPGRQPIDDIVADVARLVSEDTGVTLAGPPASRARVARLVEVLRRSRSVLAGDDAAAHAWATALADYVALERRMIRLFNELQRRIERATDAPRERELSAADISRLFPKTPRELVATTFEVELRHGHRSLIVTGGGVEAVV